MNIPDMITMIVNLSSDFLHVIPALQGFSYLIGTVFIFLSLNHLKHMLEKGAQGRNESKTAVFTQFFVGAALLFLPYTVTVVSGSFFGAGNVIAYAPPPRSTDIVDAMYIFIQMAGFIWCIRGLVLLAHASEAGIKMARKGLAFVAGGLIGINIHTTMKWINTMIIELRSLFT